MKPWTWPVISLLVILLVACSLAGGNHGSQRMELAEFSESYVTVSIELELEGEGRAALVATFSPTEDDAHLYSMELPKEGIDGLGRPTLIELALGSQMQAAGELEENVPAKLETVVSDLPALPVYPIGSVTLTLPVLLPETGGKLVDDKVLISYMACTPDGCHKPVMEKLVDVLVPGK